MFTVPTATLDRIYGVVVLGHGRRRILHVDATDHPTAQWLAQVITEAFPPALRSLGEGGWDEAPRFLVRDNDGCYGLKFRRRLKAMGVRDRPTWPPPVTLGLVPWVALAERLGRAPDRVDPA